MKGHSVWPDPTQPNALADCMKNNEEGKKKEVKERAQRGKPVLP